VNTISLRAPARTLGQQRQRQAVAEAAMADRIDRLSDPAFRDKVLQRDKLRQANAAAAAAVTSAERIDKLRSDLDRTNATRLSIEAALRVELTAAVEAAR